MTFIVMRIAYIILIMLLIPHRKGAREIRHFDHSGRNPIRRLLSGRALALMLAAVLVTGGAVGGTVAWLMSQPKALTNTFTVGSIDISIEETDTNDGDNNSLTNSYSMMPGRTIAKDPKITVLSGSENCWLFVKLEEQNDFSSFMIYETEEGWTALNEVAGVYYREVSQSDDEQAFFVLSGNAVQVKTEVTTEMLRALTPETLPVLQISAYAVQREGVESAEAAWQLVK